MMKQIDLGLSGLSAPAIGLGCVKLADVSPQAALNLIETSLELGVNFFDHADIYTRGESETRFGEALDLSSIHREDLIIQSKTGNRRGWYDFSKEHILASAENSLRKLKTDYLDILLLHRPDTLVEPEEVAEAFDLLYQTGKVRQFGVSNHNPGQIAYLQKYVKQKLIINQVQFSLVHSGMIDSDLNVNMLNEVGINRDGGILNYCRYQDITIQAWSPFRYGFLGDVFIDNEKFPDLNQVMGQFAEKFNVSKNVIATAWIMRHPARIQTMVGTLNPNRLRDIVQAEHVELSREDWYTLYKAAGKIIL